MHTFTVNPGELADVYSDILASGGAITDVVALGSRENTYGYQVSYEGEGDNYWAIGVHVIEFPPEPEPDDTKEFFPFIVPEVTQQDGDTIQPDEEQETKAA